MGLSTTVAEAVDLAVCIALAIGETSRMLR
jgi:hypothetical protein